MRTSYQRAFDHVTASDRLKKEVLAMTKQEKDILRRRIPRAVLIAAVLVLLLAGTAVAVSVPGIQDWFRQYWQEAAGDAPMKAEQREAIDRMTQPVGSSAGAAGPETDERPDPAEPAAPSPSRAEGPASGATAEASGGVQTPAAAGGSGCAAEAGAITVTLDSVAAGEDQLWMLVHITGRTFEAGKTYSFRRGELVGAPEKELPELGIVIESGLRMSADGCRVLEDGSLEMMFWYTNPDPNSDLTDGGAMTLRLTDLMADREPLVEGQWDLPFTLAETAPVPVIELEDVKLPVEGLDDTVRVETLRVTSAGMELLFSTRYEGASLWPDAALVLTDGTELQAMGAHGTWEGEAEKSRWIANYTWKVPAALEQAAAVRIGGRLIPLT